MSKRGFFSDESYDGSHARDRRFLYAILLQAIKTPDLLNMHECEVVLNVAISDEQANLRGEPRSAMLDNYRSRLRNLPSLTEQWGPNDIEHEPYYMTFLETFFSDWIEENLTHTPIIKDKLSALLIELLNNIPSSYILA